MGRCDSRLVAGEQCRQGAGYKLLGQAPGPWHRAPGSRPQAPGPRLPAPGSGGGAEAAQTLPSLLHRST